MLCVSKYFHNFLVHFANASFQIKRWMKSSILHVFTKTSDRVSYEVKINLNQEVY